MEKYKFLADKSKELLNEQIDSYTINHRKAGNVATITIALISFYLFIIDFENIEEWIIYLSIIPLILIIFSFYYLLKVLFSKKLKIGFKPEKFDELSKKEFDEILLYEIGANKKSFIANRKLVKKQNYWFKNGINYTLIAGILLMILIILSQFEIGKINIESEKVINLNNKEMIEKATIIKNQDTEQDNESTTVPIEPAENDNSQDSPIPDVSIEDLEPFEKGDDSDILEK